MDFMPFFFGMTTAIAVSTVVVSTQRAKGRANLWSQEMIARYLASLLEAQGKDPKSVPMPDEMRRFLALQISRGNEEKALQHIEETMGLSNTQDAAHVLMFQVKKPDLTGSNPE